LVTFDELIEGPRIARRGFPAQFLIRQLQQSGRPRSRFERRGSLPRDYMLKRALQIGRESDATPSGNV
jgi:hypothetical protein